MSEQFKIVSYEGFDELDKIIFEGAKEFEAADYLRSKLGPLRDSKMIDPKYGQQWKIPQGLSETVLNRYLLCWLYIKDRPELEISSIYDYFSNFNPDMKKINAVNCEQKYDVLQGIASGLHWKDIVYFLNNTDMSTRDKNETIYRNKVKGAYNKIHGIDSERDSSPLNFLLSPETLLKISKDIPEEYFD